MSTDNNALYESNISNLELINRGKVRDIYAVDDDHMLIVTSDRLSAFDVVLSQPIPGKGAVLNALSEFWFARTEGVIANHLSGLTLADVISSPEEREQIGARGLVVKKLKPLPVEAIVRGYLIGSGWKDYQASGRVCGIELPPDLQQAQQLPEVLFTPSTKAEMGEHDENISYAATVDLVGPDIAAQVRDLAIQIYREAAAYARERGIIIADTKFEFGLDGNGKLVLIDEVLTPDSSRFWPADSYAVGTSPPSYDKQFVRDYLETLDWNKEPPAPRISDAIIQQTAAKYREAQTRLGA